MAVGRRRYALLGLVGLILSGCVSAPREPVVMAPAQPPPMAEGPSVISFVSALPNWEAAPLAPGVAALRTSCEAWSGQRPDTLISQTANYAGTVADWAPLCADLSNANSVSDAAQVLQLHLVPLEIVGDDRTRFTGYYEPVIEARARPTGQFTEPVPGLPDDPNSPWLRAARADIPQNALPALGYATPADVFFLQIQGSGRLKFPDGRVVRAAYAANNGKPFRSTANWLLQNGEITSAQAGMDGIRAWMATASPARLREALNANPRFVFFQAEPIPDPAAGPNGAMGVPLTAMGSLAVDTSIHPLGVPVYVATRIAGVDSPQTGGVPFQALMVAQDTGGAIQGPVRGDIYFGTGATAGARAGTTNAPGRMWVLVPRHVADRLRAEAAVS